MSRTAILLMIAAAIIAIPVFSLTCTDSDDGPVDPAYPKEFISKPGNTTVAKTVLSDYCLREKGGVKINEGPWIKEYMCIGSLAIGKDYKCADYGYDKCITDKGMAACVKTGQTTIAAPVAKPVVNATKPKKPKVPLKPQCGDKKVQPELGEQCDPPGRLCVDADGFAGTCEKDCKCKAYKKGEVPPAEEIKPAEEAKIETKAPAEVKPEAPVKKEEIKEEKKEAELVVQQGFFERMWGWLSKTFS